ncbi:phosphatase PAP2 family protein [Streptomyces sp. NPDC051994]|uniref:phosphatase PAP2 family protein n=1 Tax=unclassified Streptomyces TaxID=2593676 RepID=UPI003440831D
MTKARRTGTAACVLLLLLALLTALVAVRHGAPLPGDLALHRWPLQHRPPVALATARAVTATGTGALPYVLAVVAGLVAGGPGARRWYTAAGALAVLALGQALRYGLMAAVARPRPAALDWATTASGHSFPSGHTTTSAITAGLLAWAVLTRSRTSAARMTVALLLLWAAAVGLSRIYLGVHWASDVLGGWLFASLWLCLAALATAPLIRARTTEPERPEPPARPG